MNEKMSFKMGAKFAVPFYMGSFFFLDILYEVRGKSTKTKLQMLGR